MRPALPCTTPVAAPVLAGRVLPFLALAALPLASCNRPETGTSVTINSGDGTASGAIDGRSGEVKLALPGFSGAFKMPKVKLNADNFDLNGVHLYPGSTIESVDIGDGGGRDGAVRVRFSSPATPTQVRDWFQQRLAKVGYTLTTDGTGLSGRTEEDKPFRLELAQPAGAHVAGTIVLGG